MERGQHLSVVHVLVVGFVDDRSRVVDERQANEAAELIEGLAVELHPEHARAGLHAQRQLLVRPVLPLDLERIDEFQGGAAFQGLGDVADAFLRVLTPLLISCWF